MEFLLFDSEVLRRARSDTFRAIGSGAMKGNVIANTQTDEVVAVIAVDEEERFTDRERDEIVARMGDGVEYIGDITAVKATEIADALDSISSVASSFVASEEPTSIYTDEVQLDALYPRTTSDGRLVRVD